MEKYRPNVAVFIMDQAGKFLLCERAEGGAYQVPQGGIEAGETPDVALAREIYEETGIEEFKILGMAPRTLKYKWQKPFTPKDEKYVGQEQTFFLVQIAEEQKTKIKPTEEFISFKWVDINTVLAETIEFKKDIVKEAWAMLEASANIEV